MGQATETIMEKKCEWTRNEEQAQRTIEKKKKNENAKLPNAPSSAAAAVADVGAAVSKDEP